MLKIDIPLRPKLDPGFVPAVLWNRCYRESASRHPRARRLLVALERMPGAVTRFESYFLPEEPEFRALNYRYLERLVKSLLWTKGGWRVSIAGADELVPMLREQYSPAGRNAFDCALQGQRYYDHDFVIRSLPHDEIPSAASRNLKVGGHWNGCRIGFDLGGSDRKCAAVIDGKCVFSAEIPWSPYFAEDYHYHLDGIRDSLRLAAKHLPRVDAIGGSSAGMFVDSCPRHASLFRGLDDAEYPLHIHSLFREAASEFGDIPMQILNDGEVTALAGSLCWNKKALLGIAMGTSEAAGYVDEYGQLTDSPNELAFVPIDFRTEDPVVEEWSKDLGAGASYFSQQAIGRLAPRAGLAFADAPLPQQLQQLQSLMDSGDERAAAIYRTIGTYFAYGLAHYADFYTIRNVLLLGRVSSGVGGDIILRTAKEVLDKVFPELKIEFSVPDETFKRHGQAMIAASLPEVPIR